MLDGVRVSQVQSISFVPGDLRGSYQNGTTQPVHGDTVSDESEGALHLVLRSDGSRRGSGTTNGAEEVESVESHPNYFRREGGDFPLLQHSGTGAFSPLSSSERQDAGQASTGIATGASSDHQNSTTVPQLIRRGTQPAHNSIGDAPSNALDVSIGPATAPVVSAFCSDELIISKFTVLLTSVIQWAQESGGSLTSEGTAVQASSLHRPSPQSRKQNGFLPASRGSVFSCVSAMGSFRRWAEEVGRRQQIVVGDGSTTIVVHVTPRGGTLVPPGSAEESLSSSNAVSPSKCPTLDFLVQSYLATTPLPTLVDELLRESITDFPRLVHVLVDASPYRRAQQDSTSHILASKRRGSVAGPSSGLQRTNTSAPMPSGGGGAVPPLGSWQPALHQRSGEGDGLLRQQELTHFLNAEPPKFIAMRTLAEAFLNLFEKKTVGMCSESPELNARFQIALASVLERWDSAMEILARPSHVAGEGGSSTTPRPAVVAKASRTVGTNPTLASSGGAPLITVVDELIQLVLDFTRIANASSGVISRRGSGGRGVQQEPLAYSFRVTVSNDFERDSAGHYGDCMWNFATSGYAGAGSDASQRYTKGNDSAPAAAPPPSPLTGWNGKSGPPSGKARSALLQSLALAAVEKLALAAIAVTTVFLVGCVVGLGASSSPASGAAAAAVIVVSIALVLLSCVLTYQVYRTMMTRVRLRSLERELSAALAVVASALTQPTNAPCEVSSTPQQLPLSTTVGHHSPPPQTISAMSTMGTATLAQSTPSPFPSNTNSLLLDTAAAQRVGGAGGSNSSAVVILGGNQTPLGFYGQPPSSNSNKVPVTTINVLDASASAKKPNPLTTESLMARGAFEDDNESEEDGVVRVRMDPTGTFLIPFMEKEPILLDGVYVHQHLAVMGVEFTRLLSDDPASSAFASGTRSSLGARHTRDGSSSDSIMLGDNVEDEDRYSICMWNLAMSEASGGYTAAQVVDSSLAQVIADNDSYHELLRKIEECEERFDNPDSTENDTVSTETFILKMVHKEHGSRALRVSLSPVIRWEGSGSGDECSGSMLGIAGTPRLVCIGVLIVGVPVDAQGQVQAFNFRNLFLSEVAEECIQATVLVSTQLSAVPTSNLHVADGGKHVVQRSPLASSLNAVGKHTLPSLLLTNAVSPSTASLTDPSPHHITSASNAKLRDYKRVNEYFMWKAMSDLSAVASFGEQPWRPLYTNFIPGMLAKSFPKYNLRVKVEPTVPAIVEANIAGITSVLDFILNTVPPRSTPPTGHLGQPPASHMSSSLRSASLTAAHTQNNSGAALHVDEASQHIRLTFGVLQDSSVAMFCRIEQMPMERFVDLITHEIALEEHTNAAAPPSGSFLGLVRAVQGKLVVVPGAPQEGRSFSVSPANTPHGHAADNADIGFSAAKQSQDPGETSLRSATESTPHTPLANIPNGGHHAAVKHTVPKDFLVILFPFRAQNGANGAVSAWETRGSKISAAPAVGSIPSSVETSQREILMNTSSPSAAAAAAAAGDAPNANVQTLTVMIDVHSELDRQKYIRRFWEDQHSVFPIEKFVSRGVKLLRSQCRTFDSVVLDFPPNVNEAEFEKRLEDVAREFPDTVFVLLRPKTKKKRHSIVHSAAAPPLAPKTLERRHSGGGGGLLSFVPTPQPKPANMHVIPKAHTQQGINELVSYVVSRVAHARDGIKRKQHIQNLFKQHRTSPWTKGKKLGRGTFGDVYEAMFTLTGGRMAVKVLRLPNNDPQRMEQLINEVEILSKVQHPNIVQYFYCEAGSSSGEVNIFMELCTGGSLQGKCQSLKSLDVSTISTWSLQLCSSLAYLHRNHLAHRDIKPANVLLSEAGTVKLADFGTATTALMPLNEVAGTFAYMAPEVYAGADYGTPCDLWSVGCVILDLLGKETLQQLVGVNAGSLGGGYFHECTSDEAIWARLEAHIQEPLLLDFLRGCFRLDPLQRCTAEQLLMHPFLTSSHMRQGSPAQSQSGVFQRKRSAPNLARKSHEASVGALSVDSGEFGRRSSQSAFGTHHDDAVGADGDSSSDDGWGDLVRGAGDDSDQEGGQIPQITPASPIYDKPQNVFRRGAAGGPPLLSVSSGSTTASSNSFTPKFHNGPSPLSRSKFVAESPAAHSRRSRQKTLAPNDDASPQFATSAAALARRQSNVQQTSTGSSGGLAPPQ